MTTSEIQSAKMVIINDMLCSITYVPNRESDLLTFMEQYQKSDSEHRPKLLQQLRACMDGKAYSNPYSYGYTQQDVAQCEAILNAFLSQLSSAQNSNHALAACEQKAIAALNALNENCNGALLDDWRREHLRAFLDTAMEQAQQIFQSANQTLQMP